ncbi:2-nitropropane dioxygenase [Roridomyces roridus]|uniref:2-nitropropane dioxygenase n=1 Tax=Roridomyces roridus TaxID=1738132 RepID=A0AAD7FJA8_9AGAR|nr:2-nitropropane dioxygenase [Roridomyces roridus]
MSADELRGQISIARAASQHLGVGFLAWHLEDAQSTLLELLSIALKENVQAVWFAAGRPEVLERCVEFVHTHGNTKTVVFVQVNTVQQAIVAANQWKVDVIVAQGVESGGHGAGDALPLINLVPLIVSALPPDGPPILAAGGLANGAHLAAVLTLGADGAVFGTRFLLAHESLYSEAQRKALVAASSEMSVRSMAWDHARSTLGWPSGIDGRGLRNSTFEDFDKGVDMEIIQSKYKEAVKEQDTDRINVWAGTGVGQMDKTQTAKSIVEELHQECVERLASAAQLYSS